jgi:hypothetical protein
MINGSDPNLSNAAERACKVHDDGLKGAIDWVSNIFIWIIGTLVGFIVPSDKVYVACHEI